MLTPAPSAVARPTSSAVLELLETAAAKIGASVETVPSMMPTSDGWTICSTNSLSSQPQTRPIRRLAPSTGAGCRPGRPVLMCSFRFSEPLELLVGQLEFGGPEDRGDLVGAAEADDRAVDRCAARRPRHCDRAGRRRARAEFLYLLTSAYFSPRAGIALGCV